MKHGLAFFRRHVAPAMLCFAVAFALMRTPILRRIEDLTLDERTKVRTHFDVTVPSGDIALIGIDETSLREFGRWPWSRKLHGTLLQLLSRARPAVVAWDVLFTEGTPEDAYLARSIRLNRSVVLGAELGDADVGTAPSATVARRLGPITRVEGDRSRIVSNRAMLVPPGPLSAAAAIGFVDSVPDQDGVRRRLPLVVRVGGNVYPTLSLRTLMAYWDARPQDVTVRLGDCVAIDAPLAHRRIPIDSTGAYEINFRHGWKDYFYLGYNKELLWSLLQRYAHRKPVPAPQLTGRIILVGETADGLSDIGPTPLDRLTPLFLTHANVIENVLAGDYVRPVSAPLVWLGALIAGVVGLGRFSDRKPFDQAVFGAGVPIAYVGAAVLLWIRGSWEFPIVGPLLGFVSLQGFMIGRRMVAELRAKERIKGMFGTYVSPELVNRLVASGKAPELGGHETEITAFFSDIQQFSAFSEILSPVRLVELMNEYLTACTDALQAEGGTLDKYIGDAIVAMFGAPVPLADHARRACVAAIRCQEALGELRSKWRADGSWPERICAMRMRIGLNGGACIIGNMGSRTRFNYTMMGDNVNLAARMESGAKSWGAYVMCTDSTRAACERHDGGRIVFRPLGRVRVMGRSSPVGIHEIVGYRDACSDSDRECLELFSRGLDRYYERDWEGAREIFVRSAACERLAPGREPGVKSNPSLVYIDITERCSKVPPPADWGGVFVMKEK